MIDNINFGAVEVPSSPPNARAGNHAGPRRTREENLCHTVSPGPPC